MATTRTLDPSNQQQRVVTQEVKTTATVTSGDQVRRPLGMACTRFICMNRLTFIIIIISLFCFCLLCVTFLLLLLAS